MDSWEYSKKLIVGGNGLLSKRPTRYSPKSWPSYFKKASQSKVLSIDNKWFLDFSEFSIGCNLFGYAPSFLRTLPLKYCFSSPLSTLNSKYEFLLAESLNKVLNEKRIWKFTRGGGESLSLAVRFARTLANKDGPILVTGYHGWHDWYLAANINENTLDDLLIPGLPIYGIPGSLKGSVYACSLEKLEETIHKHKPAILVYEGSRSELIEEDKLLLLKDFQKKGGILLADEITSGFRTKELTFSKRYHLRPDIVVLGKSLGAGYAISAVGCLSENKKINLLDSVFASSTFWTEEIGLKAGYLTTEFFLRNNKKIINSIEKTTTKIKDVLKESFASNGYQIDINNHPTMIYTTIRHKKCNPNLLKSVLISNMLNNKVLFSNNIYPSISHSNKDIKYLKNALHKSLIKTNFLINEYKESDLISKYGISDIGFGRLTK